MKKWISLLLALSCVLVLVACSTKDYAQTVIYNNAEYVVCGDGEASILRECGLPSEITKDLAGKHLGYFEAAENNTYKEAIKGDVELFEYAPLPNDRVYILCIDAKYYAAILRDNEGYQGLPAVD